MMTEQELNNLINSRPAKLTITSIVQEMMHLSRARPRISLRCDVSDWLAAAIGVEEGDSDRDIVRPLATLSQGPNARQRRALLK